MSQNIIFYPPNQQGWDLVTRIQQQIKVFPINGDMRDDPELVLETGDHYSGFSQIEKYLSLPKPVVYLVPSAHSSNF
jgi:hypothetical protein